MTFYQNSKWPPEVNSTKFCGRKNLKFRNYSNFAITFPTIWRCAGDIFKVLLKFKMAATDQLQFFSGRKKLKKLVWSFFFYFTITFLATCGFASVFLKMLPKFKIAGKLQNLLSAQNGRQRSTPLNFVGAKT